MKAETPAWRGSPSIRWQPEQITTWLLPPSFLRRLTDPPPPLPCLQAPHSCQGHRVRPGMLPDSQLPAAHLPRLLPGGRPGPGQVCQGLATKSPGSHREASPPTKMNLSRGAGAERQLPRRGQRGLGLAEAGSLAGDPEVPAAPPHAGGPGT